MTGTPANTDPRESTRRCAYCSSNLHVGARICHACGYHQTRWRNTLPHLGTAMAVITVIISGVTFVASQTSMVLTKYFGESRLELIALYSEGASTFRNSGERELLVRFQKMELADKSTNRFANIDKTVAPGKLLVFDIRNTKQPFLENYTTLEAEDAQQRQEMIAAYKSGARLDWALLYFDNNHPHLQTYREFTAGRLITIPAKATIIYSSWKTGAEHMAEFDCTAVLVTSRKWSHEAKIAAETDDFPSRAPPPTSDEVSQPGAD